MMLWRFLACCAVASGFVVPIPVAIPRTRMCERPVDDGRPNRVVADPFEPAQLPERLPERLPKQLCSKVQFSWRLLRFVAIFAWEGSFEHWRVHQALASLGRKSDDETI